MHIDANNYYRVHMMMSCQDFLIYVVNVIPWVDTFTFQKMDRRMEQRRCLRGGSCHPEDLEVPFHQMEYTPSPLLTTQTNYYHQ